jgi:hypothetical protein
MSNMEQQPKKEYTPEEIEKMNEARTRYTSKFSFFTNKYKPEDLKQRVYDSINPNEPLKPNETIELLEDPELTSDGRYVYSKEFVEKARDEMKSDLLDRDAEKKIEESDFTETEKGAIKKLYNGRTIGYEYVCLSSDSEAMVWNYIGKYTDLNFGPWGRDTQEGWEFLEKMIQVVGYAPAFLEQSYEILENSFKKLKDEHKVLLPGFFGSPTRWFDLEKAMAENSDWKYIDGVLVESILVINTIIPFANELATLLGKQKFEAIDRAGLLREIGLPESGEWVIEKMKL